MRKRILDQPIDLVSIDEAAYRAKMALIHPKQFRIVTLNPEMIIKAERDFEFQAALNNSHLVVPDGTGIVWGLKKLYPGLYEDIKRVPGIDLAENILDAANELNKKVAIFGGTKDVIEKVLVNFSKNYPKTQIVKAIDGYQGEEKDVMIAGEIALSKPDVVLVALGTPRQEVWINKYANLFPRSVMIGIGGSLDIWSGKKNRAPLWMQEKNLEWVYRVINEPERIPRIIISLPQFIWMVLRKSYLHTK